MSAENTPPSVENLTPPFHGLMAMARSRVGRTVAASLLVGASGITAFATEAAVAPQIAHADSIDDALNSYPDKNMPCEHPNSAGVYAVSGSCTNYDWGPTHTTVLSDPSTYSSRGYGYRNCTDWVAYRVNQVSGGKITVPSNLQNGGQWYDRAPASERSSTAKPGEAAVKPTSSGDSYGHVAFVEAVSADGKTMTISEYNHDVKGDPDQRTLTIAGSGFTEFVDFGVDPSAVSGSGSSSGPSLPSGASPIQNGGFNNDSSHWSPNGGLSYQQVAQAAPTEPYEGTGFEVIQATQAGDSLSETNTASIRAGDTYCVSAEVVTAGGNTNGSGTLALWMTDGATNEVSTKEFSALPNANGWQEVKTCVTATTAHSYIKAQIYPSVGSPAIGVDAVDVHKTLSANGGFNIGTGYWNTAPGTNFTSYSASDNVGTNPYEGGRFGATNTNTSGGSIYQDLPHTINAGDTFCAEAEVNTVGNTTGASGMLAIHLTGTNTTETSTDQFSNLPGGNSWTPIKTCVTATSAHSNIRVQLFPSVGSPTVGVDVLDVHESIIQNGGFNVDSSHWTASGNPAYMQYNNYSSTLPAEGSGFEVVQASGAGDSLYESRGYAINAGDTYCVDANVITPGYGSGASGTLAIWLLGLNGVDKSTYDFNNLPGGNAWKHITACVMASVSEPDGVIRAQIYPTPGGAPVGVDGVDVH
ncbi:CHAP domain-containing protein [Streptomyces sp. NPDC000987]|uniref:CHAP domain-containing protein n=1 Tax=Streptomyces sp. NPDC000987 TaxID=3154374 RepID=UPI00332418E2